MELTDREIPKILQHYHVDNLDLVFDGFEPVNPDKNLYYFHNPKTGELYVILLADFILESVGEDGGYIEEDYWPEHSCNWEVEKWLSCNDKIEDSSDISNWFYQPECGDKCIFAKLKADVSALNGRKLDKNVKHIDEAEMAARKARRDELTEIDAQSF